MVRALPLLLIVAFFATNINAMVYFHISGNMFCDFPNFDYRIAVFEWDTFIGTDDGIGYTPGICCNKSPHTYSVVAKEDDDGCFGFCDYTFEVYMYVVHNCTPDGKNRKIMVDFGSIYKKEGDVNWHRDLNMTNAGDHTIDVIGFKKLKKFEGMDDGGVYIN